MQNTILYIPLFAALALAACGNGPTHRAEAQGAQTQVAVTHAADSMEAETVTQEVETTYFPAIHRYILDSIGANYDAADVAVPMPSVVAVDESNDDDIRVWGDFWIMHYNLVGDTLKMASGGSYPGMMHIRHTERGYEVTAFERVADGSLFEPTARTIFGDKYDAFLAVYSDHEKRARHHEDLLAAFVKRHGIAATVYQDYGRPAVPLRK